MRNFQIIFVFCVIACLIIPSCSLETTPNPDMEEVFYNIQDGFEDWILPFSEVNQEIEYKNSADSSAIVVVERTYDLDEIIYTDCRVDSKQVQCEVESINLAFPENTNSTVFQVYVSIFLFGPNELRVMANRVGVDASVAMFTDDPEDIMTEIPDNYMAAYEEDYTFNGMEMPAIVIETISTDGAVAGSIVPPARMVLVKGIGLVEWEDYDGRNWVLQN